jgi:Uma2 family endonuclease
LEQINTHTPLAVLEVLSPEDTVQKLKRKLYDYQGMGIKEIWVVDPETSDWWKFVNGELVTEKEFLLNAQRLFRVEEIASELDK